MTSKAQLSLAYAASGVAALITGFWLYQLYPVLSRTGPSPGAGAQYVFVLLPTIAIATILAVGGTAIGTYALRSTSGARGRWQPVLLLGSGLLAVLLVAFWFRFALRASGAF